MYFTRSDSAERTSDESAFTETKGLGLKDAQTVIPRSRVKTLAEKYESDKFDPFARHNSLGRDITKVDVTKKHVETKMEESVRIDDEELAPIGCFSGFACFDTYSPL